LTRHTHTPPIRKWVQLPCNDDNQEVIPTGLQIPPHGVTAGVLARLRPFGQMAHERAENPRAQFEFIIRALALRHSRRAAPLEETLLRICDVFCKKIDVIC